MKLKIFKLLSVLIIFLLGFITHNGYDKFPNIITSFFFPVNESLFEHMKMIYSSYLIYFIIEYIYLKKNNINPVNKKSNMILSISLNIIIFLIIYLPIYYSFGHNLIVTLVVYFISILITQIISLKILESNNELKFLNKYSYILLFLYLLILIYFTYYPLKEDFFIDKENKKIGLNNYY